jgi:L-gulonolactone oxidase
MGCVSRNAATADTYEAFKSVEKIFIKHGGRPHWGKRFVAKDAELSKIYPKWEDFKKLRSELDPTNKFLNPYLTKLVNEKARVNAIA